MGQNQVLADILEVIDPATKDRVQAVVDKHSKPIHEALYHLTRLEIREKEGAFGKQGTLSVQLEEGYATAQLAPEQSASLHSVRAQLASLKPAAARLAEALKHFKGRVKRVPEVFEAFPDLRPQQEALDVCFSNSQAIVDKEIAEELLPEILAVHAGRLGNFKLDENSIEGGKVTLYWAVMGYFVYTKRHIELEGLAEFILAHELAHAFIHVGYDAVSRRWVGDGFTKTDSGLKEALAQYYAVKVVEARGDKLLHAKKAYEALLAIQKGKHYRLHEPWLDPETGYHPEIMRAALIPLRQKGPIKSLAEFVRRLEKEKKAFPRLEKDPVLKGGDKGLIAAGDDEFFGGYREDDRKRAKRQRRSNEENELPRG